MITTEEKKILTKLQLLFYDNWHVADTDEEQYKLDGEQIVFKLNSNLKANEKYNFGFWLNNTVKFFNGEIEGSFPHETITINIREKLTNFLNNNGFTLSKINIDSGVLIKT
jgi:hypothetical protein